MQPILEGARVPSRCLGQNRAATRVSKSKKRHFTWRIYDGIGHLGSRKTASFAESAILFVVCAGWTRTTRANLLSFFFLHMAQSIPYDRQGDKQGKPQDPDWIALGCKGKHGRPSASTGVMGWWKGAGTGWGRGEAAGPLASAICNHVRLIIHPPVFDHPSLMWLAADLAVHKILSDADMCASQTVGSGVILDGGTQVA